MGGFLKICKLGVRFSIYMALAMMTCAVALALTRCNEFLVNLTKYCKKKLVILANCSPPVVSNLS